MSKKTGDEEYIDPRVVRTRGLLRDALMELIPEKGYNAITVGDITDRATLNRATFYLHYKDKDGLLDHAIRESIQELVSKFRLPKRDGEIMSYDQTRETIVRTFEHIAEKAGFYRAMLGDQGILSFTIQLEKYVYKLNLERLLAIQGDLPDTPVGVELILQHLSSALLGVIRWWLENDMPHTPDEMGDRLMLLYRDGYYRSLGYHVDYDSFTL